MKIIHCPVNYYGEHFRFSRFWGCLICSQRKSSGNTLPVLSAEKQACIDAVRDPYQIRECMKTTEWKKKESLIAMLYARLLTWTCTHYYPMVNLFLWLRLDIFPSGNDASLFYYSVYPEMKRQQTLCLPRAIFIATTSKQFDKKGILFIGTFLPTVRMHAWVIEDGLHADLYDKQWIYYRPVMMMI